MFDTTKIAKKIKAARTEKNMTQMDLADAMGISYQAVSNWERGNSMPDISKLPELCQILGLNLEKLLGNDDTVETVKKMISDEEAAISLEELADVAPIVPPKKFEKVLEDNAENDDYIDVDALIALAPYLDDEYLSEIAERISLDHLDQLVGLAPFLEEDTLDQLVEHYLATENLDFSELVSLCPFLDEMTVRKIADAVMKTKNYDALSKIAPFM